jgi:hypothetical protein
MADLENNPLNPNPWVAAGAAVDKTFMTSAFDLLKLFLMGYGAYTLIKKAGSFVGNFFKPKEVVIEEIGEPEGTIVESERAPEVIRVNPAYRRRRRVIRRRRA